MAHLVVSTTVETSRHSWHKPNKVNPYLGNCETTAEIKFRSEKDIVKTMPGFLDVAHVNDSPNVTNTKTDCDQILTLNVGGQTFQVKRQTLEQRDQGILVNLSPSHEAYQEFTGQYFFDRNPKYFAAILEYYRTGQMHVGKHFCWNQLQEELKYWQLTDDVISDCCWRRYCDLQEEQCQNARVRREFMDVCQVKLARLRGLPVWKERIWVTLEDPRYSSTAKVVLIVYLSTIVLSFITACLLSYSGSCQNNVFNQSETLNYESAGHRINCRITVFDDLILAKALHYMELVCLCLHFTFVAARALVCPDKCRYWMNVLNILDLAYLVMSGTNVILYFQVEMRDLHIHKYYEKAIRIALHTTMIVGILRVFRAARHYRGVRELWYAIRASFREVWLLSIFVTIGVIIFGIVFYCAHLLTDDRLDNVFIGFWWALITMTTVGYGDVVPTALIGYIVAAFCALVGLVMISLPIPFIAHNFNLYYGYRSRPCKWLEKVTQTKVLEIRK